ncbi:MAG: GNAT family N-acetyltransferase [Chitinophagaceae bacterium]|nr:GNAT family N-acetyltransferase [Chitinophagaceae bacterium]
MPLKIIDHGSFQHRQMVDLRFSVLRKPLGLGISKEDLEAEKNDILIGFFDDEKLEGCCILTKEDAKTVRLRQMAVLSGLQGKGIGRTIMNFAENIARDRGFKKLTMHARKAATGFYEKLGYQIEGPEFAEVSIPHYEMVKDL